MQFLDVLEIRKLSPWNATVFLLPEIDSTNNFIKRLKNREHGLLVFATKQRKGRGQYGRMWYSEPGMSLTFSLYLQLSDGFFLEYQNIQLLSIFAAVGIATALEKEFCSISIKYPNDILLQKKKVAGILVETGKYNSLHFAIIGIGININQQKEDFPIHLIQKATSLSIVSGKYQSMIHIISLLLMNLKTAYDLLCHETSSLFSMWNAKLAQY